MRKPLVVAATVWVLVAVLSFLVLDPVLATFVTVLAAAVALVVPLAATWDEAPTFEERELARARVRAAKRDSARAARAAQRARYEARQARRARS